MSRTSRLTFVSNNGTTFALDGSDGIEVVNLVDGLSTIPTDLIVDPRIGDGGVLTHSRRGPRRVTLDFMILDPNPLQVLSTWGRLQAGLAAAGRLEFVGDYGTRHLRNVVFESATRLVLDPTDDDVFSASLLALDPWWTDAEVSVEVLPIAEPTAYDAPVSYSLLLPYSGGSSLVVTVAGDTAAFPDFYVRGPFATLTVSINGLSWTLANPLGDGVEMTVRADTSFELVSGGRGPMMATNNQVDWSLLTEASLMATLPVGDTSVVVGGTGTGANSACSMSWVGRWLTP